MSKFRTQLLPTYVPLVIVPALLISLITRGAAEQGLKLQVTREAQDYVRQIAPCLSTYYSQQGSWDEFSAMLQSSQRSRSFTLFTNLDVLRDGRRIPHVLMFIDGSLNCLPVGAITDNRGTTGRGQIVQPVQTPPPGQIRAGDGVPVLRTPIPGQGAPVNSNPPENGVTVEVGPVIVPRVVRNEVNAESLLITDPKGVILVSSNQSVIGQQLAPESMNQSAAIMANNQVVARVAVGTALLALDDSERQLLEVVNGALILSGIVGVVLAGGLGWWTSKRITQPVRDLMTGVKRLASGAWSEPLPVRTKNELGDVTQAFNTMASELMQQHQLMRQMIADVAHDLRTPISAMSLEIEAIEAGFQTPEEATTSLREEITWLQRMVDDLRTLTLIDADQVQLHVENVPLSRFLRGIEDVWRTMAEEKDIRFTLNMPDNLPAVPFDPGRMRQTLGNLLDNAIRHTLAGKMIKLEARIENQHLVLQVSDEGEGISPEHLPHIFDRFYRADPSRGRDRTGSGLGLSIARRLVEMHQGTIGVISEQGRGTTFTIRLPGAQNQA